MELSALQQPCQSATCEWSRVNAQRNRGHPDHDHHSKLGAESCLLVGYSYCGLTRVWYVLGKDCVQRWFVQCQRILVQRKAHDSPPPQL